MQGLENILNMAFMKILHPAMVCSACASRPRACGEQTTDHMSSLGETV